MWQYLWVILILIYGIFKGLREALKKKAMETNSIVEVLFFYTLFAFLMTIPMSISSNLFGVSLKYHLVLVLKAFIIFAAWLCALNSIKRLPLSVYSVMDMGRIISSILLGVWLLGEKMGVFQVLGIVLVVLGITLVNLKTRQGVDEKASKRVIILVAISGLLNSISSVMDKWLLSKEPNRFLFGSETIETSQLQFWYMLYLVAFYGIYILIKREKINAVKCIKCPWIWILSLLFVVADKCLFIANSDPNSTVVVMTLVKQSSVLVTIFMGWLIYKEKNIPWRIACAFLVIGGIMLSIIKT
ncbi:MAG: DMT family transporter [Clostridia bacterium]|nr:DMT family transporter [Clostridia bacterium]